MKNMLLLCAALLSLTACTTSYFAEGDKGCPQGHITPDGRCSAAPEPMNAPAHQLSQAPAMINGH